MRLAIVHQRRQSHFQKSEVLMSTSTTVRMLSHSPNNRSSDVVLDFPRTVFLDAYRFVRHGVVP